MSDCSNLVQILGQAGKDLVPIPGDQDVVFKSNPTPVRDIDTRFDGYHHPRPKNGLHFGSQAGKFVDFKPHTVPQTVPKQAAEPRFFDDLPSGPVHILRRHPRPDSFNRRFLGLKDGIVDLYELWGDSTSWDDTGQVALVPSFISPPIYQNKYIFTNFL